MLPHGFLAYNALIEVDPDPEGDMEYTTEDDLEDEEEEAVEFEAIQNEIPGLLMEAGLDLPPPPPGMSIAELDDFE